MSVADTGACVRAASVQQPLHLRSNRPVVGDRRTHSRTTSTESTATRPRSGRVAVRYRQEKHNVMTANESVHTLADRLLAQPTMPLRTVQFEFGWAVVTADPPDTLWQFWWAKIIGPAPVLALSYLHHISVTHTSVDAPADVLTSTLTGIDTNGSETVSTVTGVDMLAPLLAYRLAFVEHRRGEFDGALGLGLVSPIPRPSRDASDSIASQLAAADGDRP